MLPGVQQQIVGIGDAVGLPICRECTVRVMDAVRGVGWRVRTPAVLAEEPVPWRMIVETADEKGPQLSLRTFIQRLA